MTETDSLRKATEMPSGARFYRCAFQVNTYDYLRRYGKPVTVSDETSYNKALVQRCKELGIEVIAITDHNRVDSSSSLAAEARSAGLHVFPGFEAVTKEGVHLLCLFDKVVDHARLERILGDCGFHDEEPDRPCKYDVGEFLREATGWNALCIAAHVASDGGLLTTLKGRAAISVWRSPDLMSASLRGPVSAAPPNLQPILLNTNDAYKRSRPVATVNAQDVDGPDDLAEPGSSTWIKMSTVSIEGLRQAFLDPSSRVRLSSDPPLERHAEFKAMTWQGGFLDGAAIHFNENLNVLIGGRGTGKSTIVESLRYVLGLPPLGEEASKAHEEIVRHVLRSGTRVSLLVASHKPKTRTYRIERTVPNPPVLRDEDGQVLGVSPTDIFPRVEVYGQHEIAEVARSPDKLTSILSRFAEPDPGVARRRAEVATELARNRLHLLEIENELKAVEDRLASLPGFEETLKRYQEAGLEAKLRNRSLLISEEQLLKTATERISAFERAMVSFRRQLPIDSSFVATKEARELPAAELLAEVGEILTILNQTISTSVDDVSQALEIARRGLESVAQRWNQRKVAVLAEFDGIMRELQRTSIDGQEFVRLRHEIEGLRPMRERRTLLAREKSDAGNQRKELLTEWEDLRTEEYLSLEKAARRVSGQLANRVRVRVNFGGNREPLFELVRNEIGGRLAETIEVIRKRDSLSLIELADSIREGKEALHRKFGLSDAQSDKLLQAKSEVVMQIEELDLVSTTTVELNIAPEGQQPVWKHLDELSTGQKATAVLLLLLLESDAPLVVDQPEDDLDNRFITEGIVPKMREEKRGRQFVFATHNANIPVLGDAELIIGLRASGEAGHGSAEIPLEHMGSIDDRSVRELVEEQLEGGKEAFEMRRLKYGY